jgi:Transposase IS4
MSIMAAVSGPQQTNYWKNSDINFFDRAPFCSDSIITGNRFKAILPLLEYNNKPAPEYKDRFWMILSMLDAWNNNMQQKFTLSWVNCLGKLMMV